MQKKISILLVFALLFAGIAPAYASAAPSPYIVKPNGIQLSDAELEELNGEVAPWIIGGVIGGLADATMQAIDNILDGAEGLEILEGCDTAFVSGFVIGAVAPPTKIVTTKIGALTVAKEVYDVGKAAVSVAQGAAGYAAGKVYEKVKEHFSSSQTESQP